MAEVEVTREGSVQTITLNRPDVLNAFNGAMHRALANALKQARDPEVRAVVVNGAAAGAGLSFACACDLRLAARSASFVPAFVNVGLVPDSGGTFFVERLLG